MRMDDMQSVLDDGFYNLDILSYENKKADVENTNATEYIVYYKSNENDTGYSDDKPLFTVYTITVIYYFQQRMRETQAGKTRIRNISKQLKTLFKNQGAEIVSGPFDSGDIDNIGFGTKTLEIEIWEMIA